MTRTERLGLGDAVTDWLAAHPDFEIVEVAVTQSSFASSRCLTITVFYAGSEHELAGRGFPSSEKQHKVGEKEHELMRAEGGEALVAGTRGERATEGVP